MARGDVIQQGMVQRVERSPHRLVLVYPPELSAVTPPVVNPFATTPLTALSSAPTRTAPERTLRCLWHDRPTDSGDATANRAKPLLVGWYEEATALARVLVTEAAIVPSAPWAGSHFDRVEYVQFNGMRYDVLNVTPVAAGFSKPATYAVWLRGAQQQ